MIVVVEIVVLVGVVAVIVARILLELEQEIWNQPAKVQDLFLLLLSFQIWTDYIISLYLFL